MDTFSIFWNILLLLVGAGYVMTQANQSPTRRCDVPADVVFLMDASASIKDFEWLQEKAFVSELINKLEVEVYAIHVGVIVYSTEIGLVIDLQPFKTKSQLQTLLRNKAKQMNQGTDTGKAISKLIDMSNNQGRLDAKQIGVVITDGRSSNVSDTIQQARRARTEYNIDLIVFGVGNETFREELVEIAGTRSSVQSTGSSGVSRLYEVPSFTELVNVQAQLEDIICEIVPPTSSTTPSTTTTTTTTQPTTSPFVPPFPCSDPADLVFLIDGSYSITPSDWVNGKQFVSYLINSLDIGLNSINVGIVVYSSAIGDVVNLRPFRNKLDLKNAASGLIQPPVGRTNTALGLETVRDMFRTQPRPGVPHIAIVITDGMSSNPSMTRDQAALAKNEGIEIFVVGVGQRVMRQEIEDMASSTNTLFDAPDFRYLVGMVQLLRDNICTVIGRTTTTLPPSTTSTTPVPTPQPIPAQCKECLVEGGVGYNSNPNDCTSFIMCVPRGLTYDPQVKHCPFGLFWSKDAVSCLDARHVNCPYDNCRRMRDDQTYSSASSGCRGYWRCSNSRSTPLCCQAGYRYVGGGVGCRRDSSCQDPCPLDVTIDNNGACKYRPDPSTPYGYLEVIPGQGHIKRSCHTGQMYDPNICSCTDHAIQFACSPFINLLFDSNITDTSTANQPINVYKMVLTRDGSAYFNGQGYITLPVTANQDLGEKFMVHFRYQIRSKNSDGKKPWNDHWGWGFQSWYNNHTRHRGNQTVSVGTVDANIGTPPKPPGATGKIVEVIKISRNGAVIRDPRYDVKTEMTWPDQQKAVDSIQLGGIATITTPTMKNGIVYTPIGSNRLLIQEPRQRRGQQKWKIVSISSDRLTGRLVTSGEGTVSRSIQMRYGFDLRPPVIERWFILEPAGVILQEGVGSIPIDIKNRYAGFMAGTLVKLFLRGQILERWQISRPDGTQLQQGTQSLPASFKLASSFTMYLKPGHLITRWSIVDSDGTVLDSGEGQIPASVTNHLKTSSLIIYKSTSKDSHDSLWKITRPSGITVLEGQGSLPAGVISVVKGDLFSSKSYTISKWTVTLPNGTERTGSGEIPQYITDLFTTESSSGSGWVFTMPGSRARTRAMSSWLPFEPLTLTPSEVQGSRVESSWAVNMSNGTILKGKGQVPAYVGTLITSANNSTQARRKRRASVPIVNPVMDIISNCGKTSATPPSVHVFTTTQEVTLHLKTTSNPRGVMLSMPVHAGMNDVTFMYDGYHVTGFVNRAVRKMAIGGSISSTGSPLTLGRCEFRPQNRFYGAMDKIQMYTCLP